jgi:tetratricopeptide (TPR) repeat protein
MRTPSATAATALALLLLAAPAVRGEDIAAVAARAQSAFFAGNAAELGKLVASTSGWARSADPKELYAHAYVQFRALQLAIAGKRDKDAKSAGDACTGTLDAAVAKDPKFGDGYALQSACYGYLANLGGFAAISNGRKSGKSMEAALASGVRSARIALVDAFGLYFRPKIAGGDKAQGCVKFREAAAAFDAAAKAPPAPPAVIDWGAAESHYWAGRCAADAGDGALAKREFERAVALAPDFVAARKRIAPN